MPAVARPSADAKDSMMTRNRHDSYSYWSYCQWGDKHYSNQSHKFPTVAKATVEVRWKLFSACGLGCPSLCWEDLRMPSASRRIKALLDSRGWATGTS